MCMEQVANKPKAAVIDRLILQETEGILVRLCVQISGNRLTCFVMCPRSASRRHNINTLVTVTIILFL